MLTPPEDIIHISRATAASFHLHPDLRHKLVLVDEADALVPEVVVALRVLQSRGALSQSVVERDAMTGRASARVAEAKGPVAVLTTTTRQLDTEFVSRCYGLTTDTSEKQTALILEMQRRLRADAGLSRKREQIVRRHHAVQRILARQRGSVVIPFADRIEFPASTIQFRREQQKLLSLIEASALLHSISRLKQKDGAGETILSDERDFEIAVALAAGLIARAGDELSAHARDVLEVARASATASFTLADIKATRPDWTRHRIYQGLEELVRLEIVGCSRGRGKARQYALLPDAKVAEPDRIRLRRPEDGSELSPATADGETERKSIAATG